MNYKSPGTLLGLPLIHIAVGPSAGSHGSRGVAKGWIAVGDIACGVVFAFGGLAVGGISIGGLSVGVVALAGLSIAVWSVGGLALGVFALGGAAIAAWAAQGGLAVAKEYASGGHASGGHASGTNANNDTADAYFEESLFFSLAMKAAAHSRWRKLLEGIVVERRARATSKTRAVCRTTARPESAVKQLTPSRATR